MHAHFMNHKIYATVIAIPEVLNWLLMLSEVQYHSEPNEPHPREQETRFKGTIKRALLPKKRDKHWRTNWKVKVQRDCCKARQ